MRAKTWVVLFASLALSIGIVIGSVAFWRSRPPPQPATPPPAEPAQQIERGSAPQDPAAFQDVPADPPRAPAAQSTSPTVAARRASRQRADALRRQVAEESARAAPAPAADSSFALRSGSSAAAPPPAAAQPTDAEAERRRSYLRRALQEQYIPVARSCYEELLGRQPTAAGKVVLFFSIMGAADAGVVNDVETREGTTLEDPEFIQCMRESMYSTVFEAPPPGARETTVQYPLELSP